jgi:hypothetical protein
MNAWSIEYVDEDGDVIIYHYDGTVSQVSEEMNTLCLFGYEPKAYCLNGIFTSDVKSIDEIKS